MLGARLRPLEDPSYNEASISERPFTERRELSRDVVP